MPHYKWSGVDFWGEIHYGIQFAHSLSDLTQSLLDSEIGLIKARVYTKWWVKKQVKSGIKAKFIQHLAVLLKAQLRLHHALPIIINTITHRYFKSILEEIALSISQGVSFSQAISYYPEIFDNVFSALVFVGQETGKLPLVLAKLADQTEEIEQFKIRVKQALLGPILTGIAFLILLLAVFIFIIPRFKAFFAGYNQPLPQTTQLLFAVSDWLTSVSSIKFLCANVLSFLIFKYLLKRQEIKIIKDRILWRLFSMHKLCVLFYYTRFLQTLGLLLQGGVQLPEALKITKSVILNTVISGELSKIESDILSGNRLAQALERSSIFNSPELIALISVGEQSSNLSHMVNQAAEIYQSRVYIMLNRLTTFIQPLLLVILGLCVAGLICALYMPLLTLSYIVS